MSRTGIEYLGWIATAVFVGSYFCSRAALLRKVQMAGALLWIVYGVLIKASPVVVANGLVFSAAAWTMFRPRMVATEIQSAAHSRSSAVAPASRESPSQSRPANDATRR